jgi:hypothetical protein
MTAGNPALVPRVRELLRQTMKASFTDALKSAPEDLQALGLQVQSNEEQRLLLRAADSIAASTAGRLIEQFETDLQEIFDQKLGWLREAEQRRQESFGDLILLDDAELAQQMVLRKLVHKAMEELDRGALVAAEVRICQVFGVEKVEGTRNPVGPGTALKAARRALENLIEDELVRDTLVNIFQPHLTAGLDRFYGELNQMLIAENIRPEYAAAIERTPERKTRKSALGATISQAMSLSDLLPNSGNTPIDLGGIISLLLQGGVKSNLKYGARMLTDSDSTVYAHALDTRVDPKLLEALTKIQGAAVMPGSGDRVQDLRAFVQHMQKTAEHPLNQLTGELVAVVFEHLLNSTDLPETVKGELARLQIVAFKASLLDRSFFARREHPLRLLLDDITRKGSDPIVDTRPGGRLIAVLHALVDDLVKRFESDFGLFEAARRQFAELTSPGDDTADQAFVALTDNLLVEEREAQAEAQADETVKAALQADTPVFLREFLRNHWRRYLAQLRNEAASKAEWDTAVDTMRRLVMSVYSQPREELTAFAGALPPLIRGLQQGMRVIRVPEEEGNAFLDELMQAHTAVMQSGRGGEAPKPPVAPAAAATATATADTLPEYRPVKRALLPRGALVEFVDVQPPVRARLSWVSPAQTRYAFTLAQGTPRSFKSEGLSKAIAEGFVRVVDESESPLDRALDAVLNKDES